MQRTTFIAAIAAAAMGLTTLTAMANSRGGPDFGTLDTDNNGEITLEEMQGSALARFTAADTDGDGFLSQAELEASVQERAQDRSAERVSRMLERMDANSDGQLSPDEMQDRRRDPARFFDRIDADNSGGISEAEFEEARAKMAERGGKRQKKN